MSGTPGETPKIGTPPGINHGYTIERPGDGQLPASQIPCKCELVELTVHVPAYVRDAMQAKAAYTNTTVDAMVTSASTALRRAARIERSPMDGVQ